MTGVYFFSFLIRVGQVKDQGMAPML